MRFCRPQNPLKYNFDLSHASVRCLYSLFTCWISNETKGKDRTNGDRKNLCLGVFWVFFPKKPQYHMAVICRSSYLCLFQVTFFCHLKLYRCNQGPGKQSRGLSFLSTTNRTVWQTKLHTHGISLAYDECAQVQLLLPTFEPNSTAPVSKRCILIDYFFLKCNSMYFHGAVMNSKGVV